MRRGRPRRTRGPAWSADEGGGDAAVDRDEKSRGAAELAGAHRGDGGGDVLGKYLSFQQCPLGVVGAELLLGDAVHGGALCAPSAGENAAAAYNAVGVDAVDADAVLAEFGCEEANLVGLVGFRRAVGDVVGAGEQRVLGCDVDDVTSEGL